MKVLIFGATGMVGQGVLRECLLSPDVEQVVTIGRSATGVQNPKLREIVHPNLADYSTVESKLAGFDACFFCLGVSSNGMKEADYTRITYDFTMAAAEILSSLNSRMTFIYVSGASTDSSEHGRAMWARVKGRTENALLRLPFQTYMFRPGFIEPLDGIRSKTRAYAIMYTLTKPLLPLLRLVLSSQMVTTRDIGQAMLAVARQGYPRPILEIADIKTIAQ
jgi:uncharacterized protein YbjT (DUF2867 family)